MKLRKSPALAREQFAQSRRHQLLAWQERLNHLHRTPTRTEDEALAKYQALHLMDQARPWP